MTNVYITYNIYKHLTNYSVSILSKIFLSVFSLLGGGYLVLVYFYFVSDDLKRMIQEFRQQDIEFDPFTTQTKTVSIKEKLRILRISFIRCLLLSMPNGLLKALFLVSLNQNNLVLKSQYIPIISLIFSVLSIGKSVYSWIKCQAQRIALHKNDNKNPVLHVNHKIPWHYTTFAMLFFAFDYLNRIISVSMLCIYCYHHNFYVENIAAIFIIVFIELLCWIFMTKHKRKKTFNVNETNVDRCFSCNCNIF
eukprot:273419_1